MNPLENQYPLVTSQQVIWGDMDAFEHVNNTVYFRYFEDIRMSYFDKTGISEYKKTNNIGPILAHTECNFKLPLQYPDRIWVAANCTILSEKKFTMEYVVYSENYDAIAAEGTGLIVFYDYKANKSCAIPESIVQAIKNLENQ